MMAHETPAASVLPQALLPLNPAPVTSTADSVSAALPLLVSVTVRDTAAAPTVAIPKACVVGVNVTAGAGAKVAEPLNPMVTGVALDAMFTLALRVPTAAGTNCTVSVQLWLTAMLAFAMQVPLKL